MIGQKLSKRYKITAKLGEGGMGEVYEAADEKTGKKVAIKVLPRLVTANSDLLERFRREAETLRQLDHPNIVKFVDAFEHDGQYVIVMEYLPGGSLHELIKQGPLAIDRARQISLDLCDALIRAHRLNIIHRDIKPENVLIAEGGAPKLADFGVARLSEGTRMTRTGTQVGTPYYMSPEAWEGKPLDAQADIWSMGVMLFEMLSGKVPFGGDTGAAVMNKVLTTLPPDLSRMRADAPPGLVRIVRQMLTRDRKRRYQTMREVALGLERAEGFGPSVTARTILPPRWFPALIGLVLAGAFATVIFLNGARPVQSAQPANSPAGSSKTSTGIPTAVATRTSLPTATNIPAGTVLFQDDFEAGVSKWQGGQDWELRSDAGGNHYYCLHSKGTGYSYINGGSQSWKDYALEIKVMVVASTVVGSVNVDVRARSSSSFYSMYDFDFSEQRATLHEEKGPPYYSKDISSKASKLIVGQWQNIRFEAVGSTLKVFLDNQLFLQGTDSSLDHGGLQLGAGGPGLDVCFDDIKVTALAG